MAFAGMPKYSTRPFRFGFSALIESGSDKQTTLMGQKTFQLKTKQHKKAKAKRCPAHHKLCPAPFPRRYALLGSSPALSAIYPACPEHCPAPSQRCPALSALYPERCPAHPQPRKPVNSRLALQSFFTGEGK